MQAEEGYKVFRKTFHVPTAWSSNLDIAYLVNHTYGKEMAAQAFIEISKRLKAVGYMEDNDKMIHDYLHYMVQDFFDKNGEVYLTEDDIRQESAILSLLNNTTPDFILKKNKKREKTTIIDIYVGKQPVSEIKGKYKTLGFFADFYIVTPHDFTKHLKAVLSESDIDYIHKNFQVFLTEYYYWRACIKLKKILFNDVENVPLRTLPDLTPEHLSGRETFKTNLVTYAQGVAAQDDI